MAWEFDEDSNDITFNGAPVFKVYREDDFPCIEDDERAAADQFYLDQATTVVLVLNGMLHDSGPSAPLTLAICGPSCDHDFHGPSSYEREFEGGAERVCGKCGIGAMAVSMAGADE